MRAWVSSLVLGLLAACRAGSSAVPEARAEGPPKTGAAGVAVVELFTSEGCSSCPPAEDVLADLPRSGGGRVYTLAFHVDYWDDLGWPDRFASHLFTERQSAYAHAFARRDVYTPQMIVNGTDEFIGSDREHAESSVAAALARPSTVPLSVSLRNDGAVPLRLEYRATGAPAGSVLNVALVERQASTAVLAGENAGRTLHHANVVRWFHSMPLTATSGAVPIEVPEAMDRSAAEVIAYVQHPELLGAWPVLGAARAEVH